MNEKKLNVYQSDKDKFIDSLLNEIESNPQLNTKDLQKNSNTQTLSKQFIDQVLKTINKPNIPKFSKEAIEPVLSLWHSLIKDFVSRGFSTKETTLLILALKTSLQSLRSKTDLQQLEFIEEFEQILDILGILTFEMYSIENEKLISLQNEQIQYLQTKKSSFSRKIIGKSPAINEVFRAIGLILDNDLTVLLEGESGTGKDLIATTIHTHSKRSSKPFIALNCGAIPKELIESELFGHEKGSFTGASEKRIGKFELANNGTLFLDEVAELSLDLQVKLLRVLQNKQIERIGSEKQTPINVRIIAATNKNLKELIDEKKFRLDLYYRLNIFPIHIPALRDRKEDIEPLTHFFIEKYAKEFNFPVPKITKDAILFLQNQYWEGNIRELENLIQRSLVLSQGKPIDSTVLSILPGQRLPSLSHHTQKTHTRSSQRPIDMPSESPILPLEEIEKKAIQHALNQKNWNMSQVAKALQISRTTLYSKIQKYNISETKF